MTLPSFKEEDDVKKNIHTVPVSAVRIPDFSGNREGRLLIKDQSILDNPWFSMSARKINSMARPNNVLAIAKYLKPLSMSLFFSALFILLPVSPVNPKTDIV